MDMIIRTAPADREPPWELLLDADPSRELVSRYLAEGVCRTAEIDGRTVGVCVTISGAHPECREIINIAVAPDYRRRGIARRLIADAEALAVSEGISSMEIGTGNSGFDQLKLYQLCGYRISGVITDYFTGRHEQEIIEHGIVCRDMVRLKKNLLVSL